MVVCAEKLDHRGINEAIREAGTECTLTGCLGQRFIGAGMANCSLTVEGIPGNALGAYLNGAMISVGGNAQDAVGDTMNDGKIVIHGSVGDAAGYAMRGGSIWVAGDAGYRAGIHMKEYKEKKPVIVIGGRAGSFLGEYQAGGVIVVLNLIDPQKKIVGYFPCTGMHGGKMFLRSDCKDIEFPRQVTARPAEAKEIQEIREYISEFCRIFGYNVEDVLAGPFTVVTPDSKNPYKQMYVPN